MPPDTQSPTPDTRHPLPVVLVAGFLGSGKTTLMRRLILDAHQRGLRASVIVNEFGSADVDSNILREADAELIASIAGGCACCTGQNELQETLLELGSRVGETRPDVVLVEASGLADPILLLDVMTSSELLPLIAVSSIISVVDSVRYLDLVTSLAPLLRRQLQLADLILLNKRDLATNLTEVEAKLRQVNPHATIIHTEQCAFDLELFWQQAITSGEKLRLAPDQADGPDAVHTHYHTVVCPLPHPVQREKLEAALRELPPEVWRAKGFVRLRGVEGLQLVQYSGGSSGGRHQIAPFFLPPGAPEPEPALVFIGSSLNRENLMRDFTSGGKLLAFF